ncbi:MAG: CmcI family methyltransferase [bacterium]|nr:CmcI family methyltransferase [bacterium]
MRNRRIGGWSVKDVYEGHFKVTYRGVPALKCPFDYVIYQMLLGQVRPDLVIEIGTNHGGGALYLADLMELAGTGTVHTIDIEDRAERLVREHPRIKRFLGGWEGYDVTNARGFETVMVIDDGYHRFDHVLGALLKLSPLVSVGSYYIVEDGIVTRLERSEGPLDGGPLRAIHEFLAENKDFEIDRRSCDFFGLNATFNVDGYLKRIR